jgi:membrane protein DedA with SNARE-associated domain
MTAEEFIREFGYLAVFVGSFFEGETIIVAASFFASRRYLWLPGVIATAAVGAFLGHFFWFWIGRTRGTRVLKRYPRLKKSMHRGLLLFEKYGVAAIFISQYLYGVRISAAILFGLTNIATPRFAFYQFLSCVTWASLISLLGYFFGEALERVMGRTENVELWGLGVILTIALAIFIYHRWKGFGEDDVVAPVVDHDDDEIRRAAEILEKRGDFD